MQESPPPPAGMVGGPFPFASLTAAAAPPPPHAPAHQQLLRLPAAAPHLPLAAAHHHPHAALLLGGDPFSQSGWAGAWAGQAPPSVISSQGGGAGDDLLMGSQQSSHFASQFSSQFSHFSHLSQLSMGSFIPSLALLPSASQQSFSATEPSFGAAMPPTAAAAAHAHAAAVAAHAAAAAAASLPPHTSGIDALASLATCVTNSSLGLPVLPPLINHDGPPPASRQPASQSRARKNQTGKARGSSTNTTTPAGGDGAGPPPSKAPRYSSDNDTVASGAEDSHTDDEDVARSGPSGRSGARRSRASTSRFRGVSRCTKDGRWQARIRVKSGVKYLGRFKTEEEAARRYDEAARVMHNSAVLNFPTPEDLSLGRRAAVC